MLITYYRSKRALGDLVMTNKYEKENARLDKNLHQFVFFIFARRIN
jgi:hypothetical protein